jgi:hypothetical protein
MNTRKEAPKQTVAATGLSDIIRGFQVVRSGERTGRARLSPRPQDHATLHPRYDEGTPSAESFRITNIGLDGWKLRLAGFLLVVILHELLRGTTCCGAQKLFLSLRIIAEFFWQDSRKRLLIALGDRLM